MLVRKDRFRYSVHQSIPEFEKKSILDNQFNFSETDYVLTLNKNKVTSLVQFQVFT